MIVLFTHDWGYSADIYLAYYPYLYVVVLVLQVGQGQAEAALDEEEQQAEDEQDQGHHSQHVDQGLLHLQALLPN